MDEIRPEPIAPPGLHRTAFEIERAWLLPMQYRIKFPVDLPGPILIAAEEGAPRPIAAGQA